MKNSMLILVAVTSAIIGAQTAHAQQVTMIQSLHTRGEEYAVAFRNTGERTELWCTSGIEKFDGTRRRLMASVINDTTLGQPDELTDVVINDIGSNYNGVPTFHPCNPNVVAFVSNRQRGNGSISSNDIFIGRYQNSAWVIEPAPFNSPTWDDTPAFGHNGTSIYFASDRRAPGTGKADLYVTHQTANGWSEPTLLYTISSESHHEASPYVSSDNKLYYSSNRDGDQDIFWVALDTNGFPQGPVTKLDFPGVNQIGSDEYHPVFAPSGAWFLFSSNRAESDTAKGYHVYAVKRQLNSINLDLTVVARTVRRDKQITNMFGSMDSIAYVKTSIKFHDLVTGVSSTVTSDANGKVSLPLFANRGVWSAMADPVRTYVIEPMPHSGDFIAGIDTVVVDLRTCGGTLSHTAFLYDTSRPRKVCQFVFRTFNVPFFVTTYWCPTTVTYKNYTPCTSLFVTDSCTVLQQPAHCETNEAYHYTFTPAKIERRSRGAENCVAYEEFRKNGEQWANDVDSSINRMRDEVAAALNEECLQTAVARGLKVNVTIIGTTDDRSIDPDCMYTGQALADILPFVNGIAVDDRVADAIVTGKHFNSGGYAGKSGGNQLLSSLRALYFAVLFDRVCMESIPTYKQWKDKGMLLVASRGEAIDQRNIPYEYKRAAGVEINVPKFEQIADAVVREPHRRVILCTPQSTCSN